MKDVFLKILSIVICFICAVAIVSAMATDKWIIVHEGYLKSYTNRSLVFSDGYTFNGSYANKTVLNTITFSNNTDYSNSTFYELKQEYRDAFWEFRIYTNAYELTAISRMLIG